MRNGTFFWHVMTRLPELRWRRQWVALGLGFVGLVVYLSLTSSPPDLHVGVDLDFGHVVAYFWLITWFAQLYRDWRTRLMLAAVFFVMGVGLEFLQEYGGHRQFDVFDMARNLAGLAVGLMLATTPLQDVLRLIESRLAPR
jgi:VanZ family protein